MALRLLTLNNNIIRQYHNFRILSLVSSSKFHLKTHRNDFSKPTESKMSKLISFQISSAHTAHHNKYRHHLYQNPSYSLNTHKNTANRVFRFEGTHVQKRTAQTHIEPSINTEAEPTKERISYKTGYILHALCYNTFDSILYPKRGYHRVHKLCLTLKGHMLHFCHGTQLMWSDIQNAFKILHKVSNGNATSYRERRELCRVCMDVFKFVPMLIIVLVPFLEASLPFLLYIFPNMLPSRFQSEHVKSEKMKKVLAARVGLASFFEQMLWQFMKEEELKNELNANALSVLLRKTKHNEELSRTEIIEFASLIDDHKTLDNAPRAVLSNMCRLMDLNTFGTTAMLRNRLHETIREIRQEDQGINKEELDEIPLKLLEQLLRERGIRNDCQELVLRTNLSKWLDLSLDHQVSFSLLLMSQLNI